MRAALAMLAAVLLLAGCGHAKDPFVGTWQRIGDPPDTMTFVIAKTADAYRITAVDYGGDWISTVLARSGDELDGGWDAPGTTSNPASVAKDIMASHGDFIRVVWDPKSSELLFMGDAKMKKLSDSTAAPGP